jgi:dTDP-4-dehydrorhamnose 3,5-epimerase
VPKPILGNLVVPIEPSSITLDGIVALARTIHEDPRGFLVETLRADDSAVDGARFRMSYSSLTMPGQFRDVDRWHVHKVQTDRFVVVLGEMTLALYDNRTGSPSRGVLEVVRMTGAPLRRPAGDTPEQTDTHLVPIPPGVLHCIGNLSSDPFLLQNYPTELYNPKDEGRIPFADLPLERAGGTFSWERVSSMNSLH